MTYSSLMLLLQQFQRHLELLAEFWQNILHMHGHLFCLPWLWFFPYIQEPVMKSENKELRHDSVNLPYRKSNIFKFQQHFISIALLVLSLQGCQSFLDRLLDRFCFQPISQEHLYKSVWLLLPIVLQHSPESRGLKED